MVICMKKYLLIIFIFLCILIIDKKTTPEDILVFNYNKDEYYDTYEITFNDISLSKYKEIFINLDMDSYLISYHMHTYKLLVQLLVHLTD